MGTDVYHVQLVVVELDGRKQALRVEKSQFTILDNDAALFLTRRTSIPILTCSRMLECDSKELDKAS